jgi:hypothetical protein
LDVLQQRRNPSGSRRNRNHEPESSKFAHRNTIALEGTRTIEIDEFEFEQRLNCGRRARWRM